MTQNQIALRNVKNEEAKLAEEIRHNLATESYTQQHYERSDIAGLMQAEASQLQAETGRRQLLINQINAETQRYSAETGRLSYYETARHNEVSESQQWNVLAEQLRHNTVTEAQQWSNLNEIARHNVVSESQQWTSLSETARHNRQSEAYNLMSLQEQERHNQATERETVRHNVAGEEVSRQSLNETRRHNVNTETLGFLNADISQQLADIQQQQIDINRRALIEKSAHDAAELLVQKQKNSITEAYNTGKLANEKERNEILREKGTPNPNTTINVDVNGTTTNTTKTHSGGGGTSKNSRNWIEQFIHDAGNKVEDIVDTLIPWR